MIYAVLISVAVLMIILQRHSFDRKSAKFYYNMFWICILITNLLNLLATLITR